MPRGVYIRTVEWKRKQSEANSKEKVKLICKQCGKKFEVIPCLKDQKYCSLQCYRIAQRVEKIKLICEYCDKEFEVIPALKNQKYCSEKCQHVSRVGESLSEEVKKKISVTLRGRKNGPRSEGEKRKISETITKLWADLDYQKVQANARALKPNRIEQYYDELTPECVNYVGDFKFHIKTKKGNRFPDFVIEGQNKVIELFGDYYHEGEDPKDIIKEYKEVNWKCIVFWEHEVLNEPEKVLDETLKFIEKGVMIIK